MFLQRAIEVLICTKPMEPLLQLVGFAGVELPSPKHGPAGGLGQDRRAGTALFHPAVQTATSCFGVVNCHVLEVTGLPQWWQHWALKAGGLWQLLKM